MASSLDLEQSLQAIIQQATIISGINVVRLFLLDEEARVLRYRIGTGIPVEEEQGIAIPVGESFSGQVAATGKPVAIADTRKDRRLLYPQHVTKHGLVSYLGLPVMIGDRILGVLVFNTSSPRTYSDEEIAYLSVFADQAAIAIENARLFQEERAGRRQLEAVRAVSTEIARELDLDAVLDLIVRRATELTGTGTGTVYLWDEKTQALFPRAWHGHGEWIRGLSFRLGEGVVGTAAQRREGMIVNDYRTSPYGVPLTLEHSRITAVLAEPLLYRDRLLGVIGLDNESTQRPFTQEDRDILTLFAGQAAIAIENARLYDRARRAAREARSLYEVVHSLTTLLDPREVLHLISVKTAELLGTPHAQVVLWDEETKTLRFGAAYGTEAEKVKPQVFHLGEGVNGIVAETRKPLLVNDYQRFPKRRPDMTDLVAVIGVPLLYRGRLLGVLTSHATQAGTIFTADHLALLTSFANQAAIAIENARLYGEIQEHAATLEARVKERTAELEEALRVKVEFLGKMSHELRTPLNFILGFSDLLQQGTGGPLTPKQATYLDRIQGGGRRLLSLVSEVLDIAQLDAGKSRLRLEPVILAPLVQEILGLVQIPGSQKRLKATTALDPWMPFIVADRFKLAQILHSLVGNAVKFTPEGGSIRIITRQAPGAGNGGPDGGGQPLPSADSVELIVEDTGIGIRPENLETVFEAFYQVDGSDTRAQGGAGLGLALVRKLVELHGGWVWAESAGPGQGSRFVVRLPRLEVPKAKRILLVEDEALIRIPMASALESAGFAVEGAATGADALAVMEAEAFDLLILDVVLPDMEGWEILRRVREAEEVRTLPVLVVTGLEGLNAERALARGADEFLTKPVSPRVLVDTVVRLLASSAASSAGVGPRSLRTVERPGE